MTNKERMIAVAAEVLRLDYPHGMVIEWVVYRWKSNCIQISFQGEDRSLRVVVDVNVLDHDPKDCPQFVLLQLDNFMRKHLEQ